MMDKVRKNEVDQAELRRLMHGHKTKLRRENNSPRISSPLAKYDESGQLHCIICRTIVRSDNVWKVHINTKIHKANVDLARKLSQGGASLTIPQTASPQKSETPKEHATATIVNNVSEIDLPKVTGTGINQPDTGEIEVNTGATDDPLPEGFFDDPVKDAKARKADYKNLQDEEWERFKREIEEQTIISNITTAEEQDEATAERQLEEIDEQMQKWSKVVLLEKQKDLVKSQKLKQSDTMMVLDQTSSTDDEDETFDEFLDWRSKAFNKKVR